MVGNVTASHSPAAVPTHTTNTGNAGRTASVGREPLGRQESPPPSSLPSDKSGEKKASQRLQDLISTNRSRLQHEPASNEASARTNPAQDDTGDALFEFVANGSRLQHEPASNEASAATNPGQDDTGDALFEFVANGGDRASRDESTPSGNGRTLSDAGASHSLDSQDEDPDLADWLRGPSHETDSSDGSTESTHSDAGSSHSANSQPDDADLAYWLNNQSHDADSSGRSTEKAPPSYADWQAAFGTGANDSDRSAGGSPALNPGGTGDEHSAPVPSGSDGGPPANEPTSLQDLMKQQGDQSQRHTIEQGLMSMFQSELTHWTSLLAEWSKGSDKRAEMVQDMASHHHGAASKAADKVSQNVS